MSKLLGIGIPLATLVLVAIAWYQSGGMERERVRSARTPEQAVRLMLSNVAGHNWKTAYDNLANSSDVDEQDFIHQLAGTDGSLKTYASLETFDVWGLHATSQEATVRARLTYSTAVGPLVDVRDLHVQRDGDTWKVVWPIAAAPKLTPQVIPVNYLRWDVINRGAGDEWGVDNVDGPRVRIISMNPIQRPDSVVVVGEIVNEDTVPAYVNVSATLLDKNQNPIAEETSFDKISHTLLPKQVSPYRIDFPGMRLSRVNSIRMDPRAMLISASADPVIEVNDQRLETDALGTKILSGQLVDESGQIVNIPHVLASYYDANGKVIWVSDGYVDKALLPQIPVPFAVSLPNDIAPKVHSYHVVVNYYLDHDNS
jgi:hypothetical protein